MPKLLDEQERAAKSSGELSQLAQWASALGAKASAALKGLQSAVAAAPAQITDGAADPQVRPGTHCSLLLPCCLPTLPPLPAAACCSAETDLQPAPGRCEDVAVHLVGLKR